EFFNAGEFFIECFECLGLLGGFSGGQDAFASAGELLACPGAFFGWCWVHVSYYLGQGSQTNDVVVLTVPTIGHRVIRLVQWPPGKVVRKRSVATEISVEFSGGYRQQLRVWAGSTWAGVNRVNHPQGLGFTVDGVNADPCGAEALGAQSVEFR